MTPLLLFVAVVLLFCTLLSRISVRLGVPALLFFMILGMAFGSDGILGIAFEDYELVGKISTVALLFIMFYGGFGTNLESARPVATVAVVLSSAGTVLTALFTGLFCRFVLGMGLFEGLLCGAVLGSTDAASVFSILRSRKLALKENTASLLEVESGSNDPFAYMLTVALLTAMQTGISPGATATLLIKQLLFGVLAGILTGILAKRVMSAGRAGFITSGTETVFVAAVAVLSYAFPAAIGGNGFLSVYITGIILGNSRIRDKDTLVPFFDGVTGIMQMILFFVLGFLSFPARLPSVFLPALLIAVFMTVIARPAAVFLLMKPFGGSFNRRVLVSFSGLRGAASIVFAVMTVISPVDTRYDIFHIVFLVVLFSIAVQGSLLPLIAERLGMTDPCGNVLKTFNDYVGETPINSIRVDIPESHPWGGKRVRDVAFPPGTIIASLTRDGRQIVPKGDTVLCPKDSLVICAPESGAEEDIFLREKIFCEDDLKKGDRLSDFFSEKDALVILIERKGEYFIPDGNTSLCPRDRLIINYTDK